MGEPSPKSMDHPDDLGLRCRRCGSQHFRVVYTRRAPGGVVVRRRACRQCGTRITTREREVGV